MRILTHLGLGDDLFWRKQLKFWLEHGLLNDTSLLPALDALVQAVRGVVAKAGMTDRDFACLFHAALEVRDFPSLEVYSALVEETAHELKQDLDPSLVGQAILKAFSDFHQGCLATNCTDNMDKLHEVIIAWRDEKLTLPQKRMNPDVIKEVDKTSPWKWLAQQDKSDTAYPSRVLRFDWDKFYQTNGEAFLKWLRHSLRLHGFDYVLIDARTGLSKEFYVATLDLADTVVLLTGFNWQNIEGTRRAIAMLKSPAVQERYGEKRIVLVGSPMPSSLPPENIQRRLLGIREQWPEFADFNVTLPYDAELALEERIRVWERQARGWKSPYSRSMDELMQHLLRDDDPLKQALNIPDIKPGNPFALLRRDYIDAADVVRYFVDPGEVILKDMACFTPLVIEGARGTGKTMLASKFSLEVWLAERQMKNQPIDHSELEQMLYILFTGSDREWKRLFKRHQDRLDSKDTGSGQEELLL